MRSRYHRYVGRVIVAAALAALWAVPGEPCLAQVTEGARTTRRGHLLFEGYSQHTWDGNTRENALSDLLLRTGLSPNTEVRIGLPSYVRTRGGGVSGSGLGDTSLGFKFRLRQRAEGFGLGRAPAVALIGGTTLPTGESGYGSRRLLPSATLAVVWGLSSRADLATNLTYASGEAEGDGFTEFSGSIAASYVLREPLGTYLEYVGTSPSGKASGPSAQSMNLGLTYAFSEDSQVDARIGFGLSSGAPDFIFAIGVAQHFP